MDIQWVITLSVILIIIIVFGSVRQYRVKDLLNKFTNEMTGGRGGHGNSGRGSHGSSVSHGSRGMSGPTRHISPSHHTRYIGRPHTRYYGDPYLGSYGNGWWPYWANWSHWWPSSYDCSDYATNQCIGASDYQACFNTEYRNCPYSYYY